MAFLTRIHCDRAFFFAFQATSHVKLIQISNFLIVIQFNVFIKKIKNRCQYQHLQTKWWLQHVPLCLIYAFIFCVNTASVVCTISISLFFLFCKLHIFTSNLAHFSIFFSFQYVCVVHVLFQMVTHFLYLFT